MTGKDKCNLLRSIRRQIAQSNEIPFNSPGCPFMGRCSGTCPKCDDELCQLEQALEERRRNGLPVYLTQLCSDTFEKEVQNG